MGWWMWPSGWACRTKACTCGCGLPKSSRARRGRNKPAQGRGIPTQSGTQKSPRGARHPKKGRNVLCQAVRVKYAFMAEHRGQFRLSGMCRVLHVQRSGYYAWKANPKSKRALADDVLLASFDNSNGIYGSPRIHRDLREDGMACGQKRVARLMRYAQLRSVRGYKRPRYWSGMPSMTAPNRLTCPALLCRRSLMRSHWVSVRAYMRVMLSIMQHLSDSMPRLSM